MTIKDIKKLSDKKLLELNREVCDSIYNIECYGVNDFKMLGWTMGELEIRGYKNRERTIQIWKKD